ncbi:sigma-70 family RNA polymerase sigma factor [Amycolatopsis sp. FDAARGOS 1241]|uniref:sigma-70 family RNA polymerase sigma factor n=1 Tax=Amycolatopsis sp. FDAARGOS 1241 TaxID=2778070 RepID=UPI0019509CED|nr:sigma-70 family RNA polymerase sigma factor [Amycolatopsis sp. FDAARGOS 1241]QRP48421.1 sigma-70 family RNA polymerase sigma factor [Amycolatopsis sp. FDAARGOS 1241]
MGTSTALDDYATEFAAHRGHLIGVAYRLTSTRSDAEDAVQEAWLRLAALDDAGRAGIRDLRAWLTTVVGRICLDRLRSAPARREQYVGQWLPEPIVTPFGAPASEDPLEAAVRDDGIRMAALVVLDKLTPEQRVAFVLHDAFSLPFAEIADILGVSADAARQHASRARRAVDHADPPPRAELAEQQQLLEKFLTALLAGDVHAMTEVLHPDVVLIGDSDGKGRTTRQIMVGADKLTRFFLGLVQKYEPGVMTRGAPVFVNGDLGVWLPPMPGRDGFLAVDEHVQSMSVRDGRIVAIYDIVNPDKLTGITRPA